MVKQGILVGGEGTESSPKTGACGAGWPSHRGPTRSTPLTRRTLSARKWPQRAMLFFTSRFQAKRRPKAWKGAIWRLRVVVLWRNPGALVRCWGNASVRVAGVVEGRPARMRSLGGRRRLEVVGCSDREWGGRGLSAPFIRQSVGGERGQDRWGASRSRPAADWSQAVGDGYGLARDS